MKPVFLSASPTSKAPAKGGKGVFAVLFVNDSLKLTGTAATLDKSSGGLISRTLEWSKFKGKLAEMVILPLPGNVKYAGAILIGLGDGKDLSPHAYEKCGGSIVAAANSTRGTAVEVFADFPASKKLGKGEAEARIAHGAALRSYRFDKYRTKEKKEDKPTLKDIAIVSANAKLAEQAYKPLEAIASGILMTRDLVSEPANIIYPESLAAACKTLSKDGVKVEVLGEAQMAKLGMGSLLGVGQGSERESQMVIMQWNGGKKGDKPVAFIGKGVCFDTGGISIKPAGGMEEMKWDMGGAGTVIGLMKALARRNAKVNAVGVVGLVENMPDGNAQRPGDVVTSMSGQTIEVLNTDAEGRLVLADALWYTKERFKPKAMIDLATLTGAIIIALGSSRAGLFSNNDKLAEQLFKLGAEVGEEVWRLPLGDVYDKQINSDIADMKNIGEGREAGSITAAQFLQRFVGDVPWVHLDIAGVAWSKKDSAITPKGATAFGIKLLNALVEETYE